MSEPQHPVESSAFDAPSAPRERSLAEHLVVLGTPSLEGSGLLEGFSPTAGLDDVCLGLEALGGPSAETLRINAMRALGRVVLDGFKSAAKATRHLAKLHHRLGAWAAASCAREVLCLVPPQESRPRIAVETAEGWVRGEATREQTEKADDDAAKAAANYAAKADAAKADANYAAANYAAANYAASWAAKAAAEAATDANAAANYAASWAANAAANAAAHALAHAAAAYDYDHDAWNAARNTELRRLVSVVVERLVLFPAWAGDPAEDPWPMPEGVRL